MPESPRTRFRRNRATKVSRDLGRIAGKPIEPTFQPHKPAGPASPHVSEPKRIRNRANPTRAALRRQHQKRLTLVSPGLYQATCSCGEWSAEVPARRGRRGGGGAEFGQHLQNVERQLATMAGQPSKRQRARKRKRFP